jgi:hypothetical protein
MIQENRILIISLCFSVIAVISCSKEKWPGKLPHGFIVGSGIGFVFNFLLLRIKHFTQ